MTTLVEVPMTDQERQWGLQLHVRRQDVPEPPPARRCLKCGINLGFLRGGNAPMRLVHGVCGNCRRGPQY